MGKTTNHLLVNLIIAGVLVVSLPCMAATVIASDYDAFWWWSGVKTQAVLNKANTLYLLNGQVIRNQKQSHFISQGHGLIKKQPKQLWLVYRTETLRWTDDIYQTIFKQLTDWQQAGIRVIGIQIDFDAPTKQLPAYLTFLNTLREKLPSRYQLSITGLLDWSNNADISSLNQFVKVVDELVIQTYQGRETIDNYQPYFSNLPQLTIPFKIGLAQYARWQAPKDLMKNRYFKGYVVFLQNPTRQ